jgi:hypothetical protein
MAESCHRLACAPLVTCWLMRGLYPNVDCRPDTSSTEAKHRSAAHFGDCCPLPMHKKDGLAPPVLDPGYTFTRTESYLVPTAEEVAAAVGGGGGGDGAAAAAAAAVVELKMFYSEANHDNYLGTNATFKSGYKQISATSVDEAVTLPSVVCVEVWGDPGSTRLIRLSFCCACGMRGAGCTRLSNLLFYHVLIERPQRASCAQIWIVCPNWGVGRGSSRRRQTPPTSRWSSGGRSDGRTFKTWRRSRPGT